MFYSPTVPPSSLLPQATSKETRLSNFPFPSPNHQNNKVPINNPPTQHQPTSTNNQLSSSSTNHRQQQRRHQQRINTALFALRFFNHNKLQWLAARENLVASPREARPVSMDPRSSRATLARLVFRLVHDFMGGRVVLFRFPALDRPRELLSHTPPVAS